MLAGTHILVFPFPAQGHIIPLLDLTHKLANHGGLTITILVTPKNLHILNPFLSSNPSIETLVLPFPSHPSIPSGVENLQQLPSIGFTMISALGQLYHPLLNWFKSHPSPPSAILSDMFLGWTHRLATELNIRRIVFSPSGALALSVIYSLWRDMPKHNGDENDVISFPEIPNCPKYPWWQISPLYRTYVEGEPDSEFVKEAFRCNSVSWGLVINSFTELESVYLEYLKKEMGNDRVWAVGPLFHAPSSGQIERGGPSSIPVKDVMTWLDKCDNQNRKVVYICFGSQTQLTGDQTKEVASSLEISNVNFIWCVKEQPNQIPSGFEDRVVGRGVIIRGWAPQAFILSHRAVGAFLTHCGWNSVLEALVNGVPMLAWPMGADQFADATLLVDELKVGVRICEGKKTVPNSVELGRALLESVSGNRAEKERAQKLRMVALDAIKDGGSSKEDLHNLVADLLRNYSQ